MNKFKKIVFMVSFVAVLCFAFNFSVPQANAATADSIRAQIAELMAQISLLQQQLNAVQGIEAEWCHNFNKNLKYGDAGVEVKALRTALTTEGFSGLEAMGGAYEFDERLASAVVGFQEKYKREVLSQWGLVHGTGFVGKTTREKLNELYGCEIEVPEKSITVLSPNGGEQWVVAGGRHLIRWEQKGLDGEKVLIALADYGKDGTPIQGTRYIATDFPANIESYAWIVPLDFADYYNFFPENTDVDNFKYKIVVMTYGGDVMDQSDNYFSIVEAGPQDCVDSDDGDNRYLKGKTTGNYYPTLGLKEIGKAEGTGTLKTFTDHCYNDKILIEHYCVGNEVVNLSYTCPNGCADGACKDETPSITVLSPNGGEQWVIGETYQVRWTSSNLPADAQNRITIGFVLKGTETNLKNFISIIGSTTDDGNENINVYSSIDPGEYKLQIAYCPSSGGKCNIADSSDNYISIVATETQSCIDTDNGKNYYEKGTCTDAFGSYTDSCIIGGHLDGAMHEYFCDYNNTCKGYNIDCNKVCLGKGSLSGSCENDYCVCKEPSGHSITVTTPNGGEEWVVGDAYAYDITWASSEVDKVVIEIMEGAHSRGVLDIVDADDGRYTWTIPASFAVSAGSTGETPKLKVFIHQYGQSDIRDESDDYFSIVEAEKICGDVNCDNTVDTNDSTLVYNYYLYGAEEYPICSEWAADVNCDGNITLSDSRKIAQYADDPIGNPLECCNTGATTLRNMENQLASVANAISRAQSRINKLFQR